MNHSLLVALGGALGSLARLQLSSLIVRSNTDLKHPTMALAYVGLSVVVGIGLPAVGYSLVPAKAA